MMGNDTGSMRRRRLAGVSAGRLWAALSPEIREVLGPEVSRLGIGQALANALGAVQEIVGSNEAFYPVGEGEDTCHHQEDAGRAFHVHLDTCDQCRNRPMDLCSTGHRLLSLAAGIRKI